MNYENSLQCVISEVLYFMIHLLIHYYYYCYYIINFIHFLILPCLTQLILDVLSGVLQQCGSSKEDRLGHLVLQPWDASIQGQLIGQLIAN